MPTKKTPPARKAAKGAKAEMPRRAAPARKKKAAEREPDPSPAPPRRPRKARVKPAAVEVPDALAAVAEAAAWLRPPPLPRLSRAPAAAEDEGVIDVSTLARSVPPGPSVFPRSRPPSIPARSRSRASSPPGARRGEEVPEIVIRFSVAPADPGTAAALAAAEADDVAAFPSGAPPSARRSWRPEPPAQEVSAPAVEIAQAAGGEEIDEALEEALRAEVEEEALAAGVAGDGEAAPGDGEAAPGALSESATGTVPTPRPIYSEPPSPLPTPRPKSRPRPAPPVSKPAPAPVSKPAAGVPRSRLALAAALGAGCVVLAALVGVAVGAASVTASPAPSPPEPEPAPVQPPPVCASAAALPIVIPAPPPPPSPPPATCPPVGRAPLPGYPRPVKGPDPRLIELREALAAALDPRNDAPEAATSEPLAGHYVTPSRLERAIP